jgi:hypothetical protein
MPTIPVIVNRQPISGQQAVIPGPDFFGAGIGRALTDSGQVFERIQAGYDAAESAKLIGEGTAGLNGVLVEGKAISDPEKYQEFTKDKLAEVYQNTVDQASSPVVRRRLESELANNRANAEVQAKFGYFEKKKDVALANSIEVENRLADQAIANPGVRGYASAEFGTLMGQLKASGFIDADKMQARIERFNDRVIGDGLALYARNKPLEFGDNADQGKLLDQFPGANASQIQKATEIADRTISIKQARERQQLADDQARNQQLSDQKIDDLQRTYQWPDDTAQELKRINRGLKEDNPYKEQLIANAMEPMAKGTLSLNDVARAERNLQQLAGRGTVSADSTEYRRALTQIKNERNRLTIQGDIRANQADRQANQRYSQDRQRAADMLNRERPDMDPEERRKVQGTINGRLDSMRDDAAGRTKYLGELEKQFQDARKARDNWKPKQDGLRSLKK